MSEQVQEQKAAPMPRPSEESRTYDVADAKIRVNHAEVAGAPVSAEFKEYVDAAHVALNLCARRGIQKFETLGAKVEIEGRESNQIVQLNLVGLNGCVMQIIAEKGFLRFSGEVRKTGLEQLLEAMLADAQAAEAADKQEAQ